MLEIRRYDEAAKRALAEARGILDRAEADKRELTTEEEARFNALHDEAERAVKMRERLKEQERVESRDLEVREQSRREQARREIRGDDPEVRRREYRSAFLAWMRGGDHACSLEQRAALARGFRAVSLSPEDLGGEQRVMGSDATGTPFGGYAVPQEFMATVERVMKQFAAMLQAPVGIFNTGSGAPLMWPTSDDTGQTGELLGETSAAAVLDVVLGRVQFDSYTYSSKIVLVQNQLLQDEDVNLEQFLADALGERLGRILGTHLTTGTGSAQPRGIVVAAADSTLTHTISGSEPKYVDYVDMIHAVDIAYRGVPSYGWMFHDDGLKAARKLVDTTGQPIWQAGGASQDAPPTLLGYRYWVNNNMAAPGTNGNKAWLTGDFSRYKVRRVGQPVMLRLTERYAEYLQTAFLMYLRADGDLVNAGAVKYSTQVT